MFSSVHKVCMAPLNVKIHPTTYTESPAAKHPFNGDIKDSNWCKAWAQLLSFREPFSDSHSVVFHHVWRKLLTLAPCSMEGNVLSPFSNSYGDRKGGQGSRTASRRPQSATGRGPGIIWVKLRMEETAGVCHHSAQEPQWEEAI